jgi:hypothetical protein
MSAPSVDRHWSETFVLLIKIIVLKKDYASFDERYTTEIKNKMYRYIQKAEPQKPLEIHQMIS